MPPSGWGRRSSRGSSIRTSSGSSSRRCATGHRALLKRKIARKTWKLAMGAGGQPERVPVPADGAALAEPQRPGGAGAGPLRGGHRGALLATGRARGADGHRVGQGCGRRPALHPAGAAGDGPHRRAPGPPRDLLAAAGRAAGPARQRRGHRPADRGGADAAAARSARPGGLPGRRRARGVHDRSRLGAHHEARGGHRDRPRRPHLPRRHREPRARGAVRGRDRQRDRAPRRRAARDRVLRRRRDRGGLRGRAARRAPAGGPGRDAEDRGPR